MLEERNVSLVLTSAELISKAEKIRRQATGGYCIQEKPQPTISLMTRMHVHFILRHQAEPALLEELLGMRMVKKNVRQDGIISASE